MKKSSSRPDRKTLLLLTGGTLVLMVYLSLLFTWLILGQVKRGATERSALLIRSVEEAMITGLPARALELLQDFSPGKGENRLYRIDGSPAFIDNRTVDEVNNRLGFKRFIQHNEPEDIPALPETALSDKPAPLIRQNRLSLEITRSLKNSISCYSCHGEEKKEIGILRITIDITDLEIQKWMNLLLTLTVCLLIILYVKHSFQTVRQHSLQTALSLKAIEGQEPGDYCFLLISIKKFSLLAANNPEKTLIDSYRRFSKLIETRVQESGGYCYSCGEEKIAALFPGPDSELRACKTARQVAEEVGVRLNRDWALGISIHRGKLLIYRGADRKILPGEDLSLAIKLANTAGSGDILITEEIHKSLIGRIEAKGPFRIKSKVNHYKSKVYFLKDFKQPKK